MRKIISCILLVAMLGSLVGCGKKAAESTNTTTTNTVVADASIREIMLYQATQLAAQLGHSVSAEFMQFMDAPSNVFKLAQPFSAASQAHNVESGYLLRLNKEDIPNIISEIYVKSASNNQIACAGLLKFSTKFYSPKDLPAEALVYLRYNVQCHILVHFVPLDNNQISATVYPLFPEVANVLLAKYFSQVAPLKQTDIVSAIKQASNMQLIADPTGTNSNVNYYADLAASILSSVTPTTPEDMAQYSNDRNVIARAVQYTTVLSTKPQHVVLCHLPSTLDDPLSALNRNQFPLASQKVHLAFGNKLCATFGDTELAANALAMRVITTKDAGIVMTENEHPVMVVLGFGEITALVTIFPNEYNTYLYSITCLPCDIAFATTLLSNQGVIWMQ